MSNPNEIQPLVDAVVDAAHGTAAALFAKMAAELNDRMGPPFLPKGFFQARAIEHLGLHYLVLKVGDRDVELNEHGEIASSGTNVGNGIEWVIGRIADRVHA